MRILGIDPGYDRVGIAVIEKIDKNKEILVHSECLQTSAEDDFYTRLGQVGKRVREIMDTYSPDTLAIESLFITKNQKTGMRVSEARGVIIYQAIQKNIPIFEYTPPQIKSAITGHGGSDKTQITKMIPLLLKMKTKIALDDEYDAIAVALTCLAHTIRSFPQKGSFAKK